MVLKLSNLKKGLLALPFLILIISSIIGAIFLFGSTSKIEAVTFPSELPDIAPGEVTITSGRIFYPANYIIGKQYPVVVYVHGFQVTKETDLRLIFELTKRGIFALAIDLAGHGQTQERLGPYFWKGAIGAIDYIYKRSDLFNLSAVGLIGHSMGGWTSFLAMGYEAGRQNRINVSVSWAGIFNTTLFSEGALSSGSFDSDLRNIKVDFSVFNDPKYLYDHNPVNYFINSSLGSQPAPDKFGPRMLVIQGDQDSVVDPIQAIEANTTLSTNCSLRMISGEDHLLLTNEAIIRTIQYFQLHFSGTSEDATSIANNLTYLYIYLSYFFGLIGLYFSILSGIFIIWFYFKGSTGIPRQFKSKGWKFIFLAMLPYIAFLFAFWGIQMYLANVIQSLLITSLMIGGYSILLYYSIEHERILNTGIKKLLTAEYNSFSALSGFHLGIITTFGYWLISNSYSLFIYKPWNFQYFFYALLYIIPIIFFNEFFWRKIIQDNVPVKNRWLRRLFMVIPTVIFNVILIFSFDASFLSIMAFGIVFLAVTLTNIFIYSKYRNLRSVVLFSIIPIAFIAGNCYFFFM
ncbi:MAG: alpha/beta hydrolase family protein [Candidatus Helarchaeota archaeon]